ncbi:hypothetical protein PAECIP111890_02004 [Paenibacillus sp. JJ-223]|nr:hypothetical protein PAECIP111890_02004 [Paenibacillus sp. JJ-223]
MAFAQLLYNIQIPPLSFREKGGIYILTVGNPVSLYPWPLKIEMDT